MKVLFESIEQKYPDSSTGILPFLNGHVYRIPTHDGFYAFEISYCPLSLNGPFSVVFPTGEYEQHTIHHPDVPWPFTMRIEERIGKRIQERTSMFDPYQMIDMFRCNSLGRFHSHRFDTTTGERVYSFKPTRRYNRILITGPDGTIKKSYDLVQKNMLKAVHDFLMNIRMVLDDAMSTVMAEHVLSCLWKSILNHEAAGPEFRRLSDPAFSFEPSRFGIADERPVNGLDCGLGRARGWTHTIDHFKEYAGARNREARHGLIPHG